MLHNLNNIWYFRNLFQIAIEHNLFYLDFSLAGKGSLPRLLFWLGVLSALVKGLCQRNNNNKVKSFLDPPTTLSNTNNFFSPFFNTACTFPWPSNALWGRAAMYPSFGFYICIYPQFLTCCKICLMFPEKWASHIYTNESNDSTNRIWERCNICHYLYWYLLTSMVGLAPSPLQYASNEVENNVWNRK